MPVYKILEEMPYEELMAWMNFFSSRPIGWREDQRTYMLLKAQGVKESAETLFPSLKQIASKRESAQTPDKAIPKGRFLELMLKAKGGDKLDKNFYGKS